MWLQLHGKFVKGQHLSAADLGQRLLSREWTHTDTLKTIHTTCNYKLYCVYVKNSIIGWPRPWHTQVSTNSLLDGWVNQREVQWVVSGFRFLTLQEGKLLSLRQTQKFPGPEQRTWWTLTLPSTMLQIQVMLVLGTKGEWDTVPAVRELMVRSS